MRASPTREWDPHENRERGVRWAWLHTPPAPNPPRLTSGEANSQDPGRLPLSRRDGCVHSRRQARHRQVRVVHPAKGRPARLRRPHGAAYGPRDPPIPGRSVERDTVFGGIRPRSPRRRVTGIRRAWEPHERSQRGQDQVIGNMIPVFDDHGHFWPWTGSDREKGAVLSPSQLFPQVVAFHARTGEQHPDEHNDRDVGRAAPGG